jgi:sugar-specific transcriptional regulator TrmB
MEEHFRKIGFNEKEQNVYTLLVKHGKSSVSSLSKICKIPRATLYSTLESLLQKGVISREPIRGSKLFTANGLSAIDRMVEVAKEEIVEKEKSAKILVEMLSKNFSSMSHALPRLQIFEGKNNVENMLYEYLPLWRRSYASLGNNTLWGYQDPTFVDNYQKWHKFLWETMQAEEKIKLFSNSDSLNQEVSRGIQNREVKPLPKGTNFSSSIWIYGEYIVMGITNVEPHYVVQMKDPMLSSNLRTIFELLWLAKF